MFNMIKQRIPAVLCVSSMALVVGCAETDSAPEAEPVSAVSESTAAPESQSKAITVDPTRNREASHQLRADAQTPAERPTVGGEVLVVAEPAVLNLGMMSTGETKRGTVTLVNKGDRAMRIQDSRTSCGCTVANVPKGQELAPGESVDVEVSLRGGARPERMSKTVTFIVEDQPNITVQVQGEAVSYVTMMPDVLDPDQLPDGRVTIRSEDGEEFRITAIHPQIIENLGSEPAAEHELTVSWDRWEQSGQPRRLLLYIDHPKTSQIAANIRVPANRAAQRPSPADVRAVNDMSRSRMAVSIVDLIKQNNTEAAKVMIAEDGFDIEQTDTSGVSLLGLASKEGNLDLMRALLDAGADIESPDRVGRTPLMQAAQSKNVNAVRLLIEAGANVDQRDAALGNTALSWAAGFGDAASVQELIENGAQIEVVGSVTGYTPLIWAAGFGEAASVRLIAEAGANIEVIDTAQGFTPLMHAARTGKRANIEELIRVNANLEAQDPNGRTVLLIAAGAAGADAETIQVLIDAGADLSATDSEGNNALQIAQRRNDMRKDAVVAVLEPLMLAGSAEAAGEAVP